MKKVLIIIFALAISVAAYISYNNYKPTTTEKVEKRIETVNSNSEVNEAPVIQYINYDKQPAKANATYFEEFPIVSEQQAYFALPLKVDPEKLPRLIVYSHGSNTTVTTNFEDQFTKDLQYYGEYFASRGFGFAASNQHGMNYGNQASIDDTSNLITYIQNEYDVKEKVGLIGFSMGGLPAIYFTSQNPTQVSSMALLAPVTYIWGATTYTPLKGIPIKIWHGDRDVNVGYNASTGFISRGEPYEISVELRTIEGAGHFDIDTEMADEIYDFFIQND